MNLFWDGIQIGLVLCIMTGPIFFALIQVAVEEGMAAGTMVGLGIWLSDILFIFGISLGMAYVHGMSEGGSFSLGLGWLGGAILVAFGLGTALSKPQPIPFESKTPSRYSSWVALWMKGFLINTINPFTFFFWIGIASTKVVTKQLSTMEAILFFSGIMLPVILADLIKIYSAKEIRQYLQLKHILWLRWISGGALVLFGIVLILRVSFG